MKSQERSSWKHFYCNWDYILKSKYTLLNICVDIKVNMFLHSFQCRPWLDRIAISWPGVHLRGNTNKTPAIFIQASMSSWKLKSVIYLSIFNNLTLKKFNRDIYFRSKCLYSTIRSNHPHNPQSSEILNQKPITPRYLQSYDTSKKFIHI